MDDYLDLEELARAGAQAVAAEDFGRSAHLIQLVAERMAYWSLEECEWMSVAVSNGAISKQMSEIPQTDGADIHMEQTPDGEVWDI